LQFGTYCIAISTKLETNSTCFGFRLSICELRSGCFDGFFQHIALHRNAKNKE
jgi:hypothetical protein